jgi:hypothetical protein
MLFTLVLLSLITLYNCVTPKRQRGQLGLSSSLDSIAIFFGVCFQKSSNTEDGHMCNIGQIYHRKICELKVKI